MDKRTESQQVAASDLEKLREAIRDGIENYCIHEGDLADLDAKGNCPHCDQVVIDCMSKIQKTLYRAATSETASAGTSEQPSLTFSELLEKWKKLGQQSPITSGTLIGHAAFETGKMVYLQCNQELAEILARLEALAAEWEAQSLIALAMENTILGNTVAAHAQKLRAILGKKTP